MTALTVFVALLALLFPGVMQAGQPTLEEVLTAHCSARATTSALKAKFVQTKIFTMFDEEETSKGEFFFAQPDQVCWQYSDPDKSSTVISGGHGWSVFPDIKQVQKFELDGSRTNKVLSIVGFGSCSTPLTESFEITLAGSGKDGFVLEMKPVDKDITPYFSRVDLTLDRSDYLPRRIELHEKSGDLLIFEFLDLARDVDMDETVFSYQVPDGYEVIEY